MAARWLETDSGTNVDISAATSIGAYTADADRIIVCDVSVDQVAGNGDYVVYLTRQINGAGAAYVMLPKTTCAAASGETAIAMQSGMVTVRSGDVVTCYIDGLAGDTTTPDPVVRWFEVAALQPTVAGRTLDVSATGEAGVDWANVGSPTTTLNLSGTTVKASTDTETDIAALNNLGAADIRTAVGLASANLDTQFDNITATVDEAAIAAAVSAGVAPAVWTHASRTLTATAAATAAAVTGSALAITRAATWSATISGLNIGATWTAVYFTIKANDRHDDDNALLQVIVSNPAAASTDGVLYVNRAAATAGQRTTGALTVNQGAGTVAIALQDDLTELLPLKPDAVYDLKALYADGSSVVLTRSTATISAAVTGAI